jgi:hypothetical protein
MKPGCLGFLFCVILAAAFAGLVLLRDMAPRAVQEPHRIPPVTVPTPLPDRYLESVPSLSHFGRNEAGGRYLLSYGFVDHHGRGHEVSCAIDRAAHQQEMDGFGYDESKIEAAVDAKVRAWFAKQLAARGLTSYLKVAVSGGRASAEPALPPSLSVAEHNRLVDEINRFYKFWDRRLEDVRRTTEETLYKERGFILANHHITIDYAGISTRSRRALSDCFQALEQAAAGYNERQFLGLVLGFLQEIRYELPPEVIEGRRTLGFWVPTEVLVNDHGDCDSKSAAFAALWRSLDAPMLFVSLPRHMLVGVAVKPGPGEKYVLVKNRYFVLCEVAGPAKLYPGERDVSGDFEYVLMEPDRGEGSATVAGAAGS